MGARHAGSRVEDPPPSSLDFSQEFWSHFGLEIYQHPVDFSPTQAWTKMAGSCRCGLPSILPAGINQL